ncbi:hypothetical protein HY992_02990 [Candidatus Micrarchaeota archaeon]|nr:hypothetical protein [Candidatus Micrarchaeota archaeon]
MNAKGQAAAEYLIIVAVVVIIVLIIVGVLGGFQGVGTGISEQQSSSYWSGTEIAIQPNYRLSSTSAELTLKNNRQFAVQVQQVSFNGIGTLSSGVVDIGPSSSADVVVNSGATAGCVQGAPFSYNVSIVYSEPASGRNFSVIGTTPLTGTCQ